VPPGSVEKRWRALLQRIDQGLEMTVNEKHRGETPPMDPLEKKREIRRVAVWAACLCIPLFLFAVLSGVYMLTAQGVAGWIAAIVYLPAAVIMGTSFLPSLPYAAYLPLVAVLQFGYVFLIVLLIRRMWRRVRAPSTVL
jgi:hypothetical protein